MRRKSKPRHTPIWATALALLLLLLTAGGHVHRLQAQTFLAGFEDVPVMPDLIVVEGAGIDFDTPSGRIAEAYATGNLTPKAVLDFYRATLRQLGWQEVAGATFEREGETLRLDFEDSDGELTVRFRLSPVGTNTE